MNFQAIFMKEFPELLLSEHRSELIKFNQLASEHVITKSQWLIIYSILLSIERSWRMSSDLSESEISSVMPITAMLQIIDQYFDELYFEENSKFSHGFLLGRECILFLGSIMCIIFQMLYENVQQLNSKNKNQRELKDIPIDQLRTNFNQVIRSTVRNTNKGFGHKAGKNQENLFVLLMPILDEKNFTLFVSMMDEIFATCSQAMLSYKEVIDLHVDVHGFFDNQVFDDNHVLFGRVELEGAAEEFDEGSEIFNYANRHNIEKISYSEDKTENLFYLMVTFLDQTLPMFLNCPIVSTSYGKVQDKFKKRYVTYCHINLQEQLIFKVCSNLESLFNNYEENSKEIGNIKKVMLTGRYSTLNSILRKYSNESNWSQIITKQSIIQIRDQFVELCEYFDPDQHFNCIDIIDEYVPKKQEQITDTEEVIIEQIKQLNNTVLTRSKLWDINILIVDKSSDIHWPSLNNSSSRRVLDDLADMIEGAKSSITPNSSIFKTLLRVSMTPDLFNCNKYVPSSRLTIFNFDEGNIKAGDLEVRVGKGTRLFLRQIDNLIKVVFFGNPSYH